MGEKQKDGVWERGGVEFEAIGEVESVGDEEVEVDEIAEFAGEVKDRERVLMGRHWMGLIGLKRLPNSKGDEMSCTQVRSRSRSEIAGISRGPSSSSAMTTTRKNSLAHAACKSPLYYCSMSSFCENVLSLRETHISTPSSRIFSDVRYSLTSNLSPPDQHHQCSSTTA